jgi:hypothetical protein
MGGDESDFQNAAAQLSLDILNAMQDGLSYSEMMGVLVDSFTGFISGIGAKSFTSYLNQYLDTKTGISGSTTPLIPRTFELFTGTEQTLTFWQLAEQIVQKPFSELWIDNGSRKVSIDGKNVALPEKSCFVLRDTPFNDTVGGFSSSAFTDLPEIYVDEDHLLQFDLSKGMDEVYTVYSVKEPAFLLSDVARLLLGQFEVDTDLINKYLFKPMVTELFYTRMETTEGDDVELIPSDSQRVASDYAQTLNNWFKNNDQFLSGAITHMVPSENEDDPKIGDKLRVYGIDGNFYVEGVSHTWTYQGALRSSLTVTRDLILESPFN